MHHARSRTGAALVAVATLLAGCSSTAQPDGPSELPSGAVTPSTATPSATATASIAPLTPDKQQAVDQATDAVRAYWQTYYDVLGDPTPDLNDLNTVTVQPQLALDLRATQQLLSKGTTTLTTTGPVEVSDVDVLRVNLKSDPPRVTLVVCVDTSSIAGTTDGKAWTGGRNEMKYRVVKTEHVPGSGWAVAEVLPPAANLTGSRPC